MDDMSDAGEFIDQVLDWDGADEAPASWARNNEKAILDEAGTGAVGPIMDALDSLDRLASSDDTYESPVGAWGLSSFFVSLQEVASAAFQKTWGFVSRGAQRVTSLWNALSVLFHRYAHKLSAIANKLGATGYTIALNLPLGFSVGLNFDF